MQHTVLYNGGAQTLRHVPMSPRGIPTRVSSATYVIVDSRQATEVIESTAATLAATTTTLSGPAGPGVSAYPKQIPVANSAGFVEGRTYLLAKADGKRQAIVVERVASGMLHASKPLQGAYASGDTVSAIELEATFPSDEAASGPEAGPYQILWTYTLDGRDWLVPEVVQVSRYSIAPWITPDEVLRAYPALATRTGASLPDAISVASEDMEAALRAGGKDPAYYRGTIEARVALRWRTLEYCHRWMASDEDKELAVTFASRWDTLIHNMLNGQPPRGTVEIDPASDVAKTGPLDHSGLFVRP
jgi:hypothetical protein